MSDTFLNEKKVVVYAIALRYWELNSENPPVRARALCERVLKEVRPKESVADDGLSKDNLIRLLVGY